MKDEQAQKSKIRRFWSEWLKPFVIVLVVFSAMRSSLADWNDVPTQSMEPTILVGDRIAVNKLAYGLKVPFTTWHLATWDAPQRGEIIVFYSPKDDERMVKRVVGLPGDRVAMMGNRLIINDKPVDIDSTTAAQIEAFDLTDTNEFQFALESLTETPHQVMFQPTKPALRTISPINVPEGHYLVLGDNRDNSADSRYFGFVPQNRIVGRAFGVAISLDMNDRYKPRWNRFFQGLK